MNSNTAIYPGTFDPITNGHLEIIERASRLFAKVIVAVGDNPDKKPMFSVQQRIQLIKAATKGMNVEVEAFSGMLADYAKKRDCSMVIRSLRAISDFDYEFQMHLTNKEISPGLETIFLMTGKEHLFLHSGMVREILRGNGDISRLVPKGIAGMLPEMIKTNSRPTGKSRRL